MWHKYFKVAPTWLSTPENATLAVTTALPLCHTWNADLED